IGAFALLFGPLQYFRDRWRPSERPARFHPSVGVAIGCGSGLCSTLSHLGGIFTTSYLVPQRLPNSVFAATASALYCCMNLAKLRSEERRVGKECRSRWSSWQ